MSPLAVAESTNQAGRPGIALRAIGCVFREPFLDVPPDELGERHATFAGLRAQPPGLLVGELNLGPDHVPS
jgi:hypothetical protein